MKESDNNKLSQTYNIANWLLGNFFVSLGIAFATKADFGLSMIAAPVYILHVWLRGSLVWFSQGVSEYVFEALVLIAACCIVRQFKLRYLLSFLEALFFGTILDLWFLLFKGNGAFTALSLRIFGLAVGILLVALGVAFFFRTSLPLQTYELTVVEIAKKYCMPQHKVKQIFDGILLALSLLLSFLLTGKLTGIGISTVISTLFNARLIKSFGILIDKLEKNNAC